MTTQLEQAARLALEALENIHPGNMTPMAEEYWSKAITALRAALEKPAQDEPVAWGVFEGKLHDMFFTEAEAVEMAQLKGTHAEVKPLYTRPQAHEPLTDEQMKPGFRAWKDSPLLSFKSAFDYGVRFAEAAHGIKGKA